MSSEAIPNTTRWTARPGNGARDPSSKKSASLRDLKAQGIRKEIRPKTGTMSKTFNNLGKPASQKDGLRKNKLQSRSPGSLNWQDRYTALEASRKTERANAIRNGQIADPDKPRSLADAITLVGTCQDMCAEFERVERVVQKDVWKEETDPGSLAANPLDREPDEVRMVKKFRRAAAGIEEQLPSDLRPPIVLKKTCDYLFNDVVGNATTLGSVHHFVWDRTRAIRNDFSIQQISRPEDLSTAIECYERIARFHIVSLHQLALPTKPYDKYDWQQEREQLDRTLLSLMQYYEDARGRVALPNEAEFRAYCVIFQLQDPVPDLEDRVQSWPRDIATHPRVNQALRLYAAACTTNDLQGPLKPPASHSVAQQDWHRFWNLVESKGLSYLMACVAEIYFNLIRKTVLRLLLKSTNHKIPTQWSLEEVQKMLAFDDEEETEEFCERYGLPFKEVGGRFLLDLSVLSNKTLPEAKATATKQTKSNLVEQKRAGRTLPAVINGLTIKQARQQGMIQEDDENEMADVNDEEPIRVDDGDEQSSDDALFVSERETNADSSSWFSKPNTVNTFAAPSAAPVNPSVNNEPNTSFKSLFQNAAPQQSPFGLFKNNGPPTDSQLRFGRPSSGTNERSPFAPPPSDLSGTSNETPATSAPSLFAGFGKTSGGSSNTNSIFAAPTKSIATEEAPRVSSFMFTNSSAGQVQDNGPDLQRPSDEPAKLGLEASKAEAFKSTNASLFTKKSPFSEDSTSEPSSGTQSVFSFLNASKTAKDALPAARAESTNVPTTNPFESLMPVTYNGTITNDLSSATSNTTQGAITQSDIFSFPKPEVASSSSTSAAATPLINLTPSALQQPNFTSTTSDKQSIPSATPAQSSFTQRATTIPSNTAESSSTTTTKANATQTPVASPTKASIIPQPDPMIVFDTLSRELTLDPEHGILQQYIDYVVKDIITQAQWKVYFERIDQEAREYRAYKLSLRYGLQWREICRRLRLARKGQSARRRARQRLSEARSQQADTASVVSTQLNRKYPVDEQEQLDKMFQQSIKAGRWTKLAGKLSPKHVSRVDESGRVTKPKTTPAISETLRHSVIGASPSPIRNTTQTSYFRRKALGLDVSSDFAPRSRKRSHSEMTITSQTESQKPAELSSPLSSPAAAAIDERSSVDSQAVSKLQKMNVDDDTLFARLRAARESLAESELFYRDEVAKSESPKAVSPAPAMPTTAYQSPSLDRARSEARQRQAFNGASTDDIPAYRLRESKFVPRELYGKAIENARIIRESRSQVNSRPASRLSMESVEAPRLNGINGTRSPAMAESRAHSLPQAKQAASTSLNSQLNDRNVQPNTNAESFFGTFGIMPDQHLQHLHNNDWTVRPSQIPASLDASFGVGATFQEDVSMATDSAAQPEATQSSNAKSYTYGHANPFQLLRDPHSNDNETNPRPQSHGDVDQLELHEHSAAIRDVSDIESEAEVEQENEVAFQEENDDVADHGLAPGDYEEDSDLDQGPRVLQDDVSDNGEEFYDEDDEEGGISDEDANHYDGDLEEDEMDEDDADEGIEDSEDIEDSGDDDEDEPASGLPRSMNGYSSTHRQPQPVINEALKSIGNNEADAIELSD